MVALTPAHFRAANGFSNAFYGWGGEDDDFLRRVEAAVGGAERADGEVGRCVEELFNFSTSTRPGNPGRFKFALHSISFT